MGIRVSDAMAQSAAPYLPDRRNLAALRRAAPECRGCPLWRSGTQTVFGTGRRRSRLMLVGEQPGDRKDRAGKPFVGPAGRELDRALDDAGIDRGDVYLTNAVKHFKWRVGRGKRRIHQRPSAGEIAACRPWLDAELAGGPTIARSAGGPAGSSRPIWPRSPNGSSSGLRGLPRACRRCRSRCRSRSARAVAAPPTSGSR